MPNYTSQDLFHAIRNQDVPAIKSIASADPTLLNQSDERGFLPLVLATYSAGLPTTKALVEAGADVNTNNGSGTALMGVCFKGHVDVARFLIEAGADVNASSDRGDTPMSYAKMGGHQAIVNLLQANGAK